MNKNTFKVTSSPANPVITKIFSKSGVSNLPFNILLNKNVLPTFTAADKILYHPFLKPIRRKIFDITGSDNYCRLRENAAFTLAETMVVLVVLGIVASITIPALVRRQADAQNRTRLRKAMTVYDTNNDNCVKPKAYFKTVQDDENNNCIFRAADGIWWDITDITNPKIAFNKADLNEADDLNSNNAFNLIGYLDDYGSLRVDDLAKAEGDNKDYLTKLYNFINNKSSKDSEENNKSVPECNENITTSCLTSYEFTAANGYCYGNNNDCSKNGIVLI